MVNVTPKLELHFSSHKEFHLYYLTQHTDRWCKRLHLVGTGVGVAGAVAGLLRLDALLLACSLAAGVAIAWAGDYACQRTTPTTFKHPIWSVQSNFKMVQAMLKGDMSI